MYLEIGKQLNNNIVRYNVIRNKTELRFSNEDDTKTVVATYLLKVIQSAASAFLGSKDK